MVSENLIISNNKEAVDLLRKYGTKVNIKFKYSEYENSLFWAIETKNYWLLPMWIEDGGDINGITLDPEKYIARNLLEFAIINGENKLAELLIEHGINIYDETVSKLFLFFQQNGNETILQLLPTH